MIIDEEDHELRSAFAAMREHDAAHAPSFGALRDKERSSASALSLQHRIPGRKWARVAAAAVVVAALGIAAVRSTRRQRSDGRAPLTPNTSSITSWRSPTRGLLQVPGGELLVTPSVYSSVLADAPRPSAPRKGD
jgi:hypothetical protein